MIKQFSMDNIMDNIQIIRKKNMKNIRLRVKRDGQVIISAPYFVSDAYLHAFIDERKEWIVAQKSKIQPLVYETGALISLFDQTYQLVVIQTEKKRATLNINKQQMIMHIPVEYDQKQREVLLHRFYQQQMDPHVIAMVKKYEKIMHVKVENIKYQHMQTRWGTCHIGKKMIRLNTRLAMFPLDVIESVVVHELVHLLEAGHNKRFYYLMDQFYPFWKACDAILKRK